MCVCVCVCVYVCVCERERERERERESFVFQSPARAGALQDFAGATINSLPRSTFNWPGTARTREPHHCASANCESRRRRGLKQTTHIRDANFVLKGPHGRNPTESWRTLFWLNEPDVKIRAVTSADSISDSFLIWRQCLQRTWVSGQFSVFHHCTCSSI